MSSRKMLHEIYHNKIKKQPRKILPNNFTYRLIISVLDKYVKQKQRVLDIGCGAGTLSFYLADKVKSVTGIDISKKAVDACKETAVSLKIKNTHFKVLDFPSQKLSGIYDFIIFSEVIEHIPDDKLALKDINKLLSPNGLLFISTPSIDAPLHRLGVTKDFDKRVGHVRRYSEKVLIDLLEANGFKIIEINKTEGIIRNFLFVDPAAGKFVRFVKYFLSDIITFLDNVTIPLFGFSNFIIVAGKK